MIKTGVEKKVSPAPCSKRSTHRAISLWNRMKIDAQHIGTLLWHQYALPIHIHTKFCSFFLSFRDM